MSSKIVKIQIFLIKQDIQETNGSDPLEGQLHNLENLESNVLEFEGNLEQLKLADLEEAVKNAKKLAGDSLLIFEIKSQALKDRDVKNKTLWEIVKDTVTINYNI